MFVPQGWRHDLVGIDPAEQWAAMSSIAAHAEAGPWESIWVYDHFHTVPVPSREATHEAWTLMSAFAATTSRIRLGQMCTCMSYRNPAYLAKVASTIDIISRSRSIASTSRCCADSSTGKADDSGCRRRVSE